MFLKNMVLKKQFASSYGLTFNLVDLESIGSEEVKLTLTNKRRSDPETPSRPLDEKP